MRLMGDCCGCAAGARLRDGAESAMAGATATAAVAALPEGRGRRGDGSAATISGVAGGDGKRGAAAAERDRLTKGHGGVGVGQCSAIHRPRGDVAFYFADIVVSVLFCEGEESMPQTLHTLFAEGHPPMIGNPIRLRPKSPISTYFCVAVRCTHARVDEMTCSQLCCVRAYDAER